VKRRTNSCQLEYEISRLNQNSSRVYDDLIHPSKAHRVSNHSTFYSKSAQQFIALSNLFLKLIMAF